MDCPSLQCFGKLAPTANGRVWSLIHPGCLVPVTSPPSASATHPRVELYRIVSSWQLAGGCRSAASRPLPLLLRKTVQKTRTIVQNYTLVYSASAHSHSCTQIVHTRLNKCVYLQHKVVQNVPCTMLYFQNPFPLHISLKPRPFRCLYIKHGPMSWHCLDIVFDVLLAITCCQYVLPFCCLAGADCLMLVVRGNTKLAKFTQSRSTIHSLFLLLAYG